MNLESHSMPVASNERVGRFWDELDACEARISSGGIGLDLDCVASLVRADASAATRFVEVHCMKAASHPAHLQQAYVVADVFNQVFDDPNLLQSISQRLTEIDGWEEFIDCIAPHPESTEEGCAAAALAQTWWTEGSMTPNPVCDQCHEAVPNGDGYGIVGRRKQLYDIVVDLGQELLCRRCFKRLLFDRHVGR